jgi:hypothetical protein
MQVTDTVDDQWTKLDENYAPVVLHAPKTWGDPSYKESLHPIDSRIPTYLAKTIAKAPWRNELALTMVVMHAHHLDPGTIIYYASGLNTLFRQLFAAFHIQTLEEWNPSRHLREYLQKKVCQDDSHYKRRRLFKTYCSSVGHLTRWLQSLPETEQEQYRQFVLPDLDRGDFVNLLQWKEVRRTQQEKRKLETEAVVHRLAEILAEAHFRYNLFLRLHVAFLQAVADVENGKRSVPCYIYLKEGGDKNKGIPARELLTFRLWDRRSFVLAHASEYSKYPVSRARHGLDHFAPARTTYFLEYLKAESLDEENADALVGLWFAELIEHGVLGSNLSYSKPEAGEARKWLTAAGYQGKMSPFWTPVQGLGSWSKASGESSFMRKAEKVAEGLLIPVENLYPALTFGLAALDIFCSSGMRLNELLQIRTTKDCLMTVQVDEGSRENGRPPEFHFAFQLIPKGQRLDKAESFWVGLETIRLLATVGKMLQAHYGLREDEALPSVPFTRLDKRHHRFAEQPYLFQFNNVHLSPFDVNACMRLLVHGLGFQAANGDAVVLKAHLLRHAFANWAVQVEKQPIDIVAAILHQKDIDVTKYYAQATQRQVAGVADELIARFTNFINVGELLIRGPQQLQKMLEEARGKRGTLVRVIGGVCTLSSPCAAKFACIGCPAKVVDPSRRQEVKDHKGWNLQQAKWAKREGFLVHQQQHEQQARHADAELREMDLIEAYKEDASREPDFTFGN